MRINIASGTIPYPMTILKGYLRLAGLSSIDAENIVKDISEVKLSERTEKGLFLECESLVQERHKDSYDSFCIASKYNSLLREGRLPHLVLVLLGASATGKSILAMNLIQTLAASRIISTDSIRQILRSQTTEREQPELFCHTFQAHKYGQLGPDSLPVSVRGYLAQISLIKPSVLESVQRILDEGVSAIIEGVHLIPDSVRSLRSGIIEVVIHPDRDTHFSMFVNKSKGSGLKTVSSDENLRSKEFDMTREIQDYLLKRAQKFEIPIVQLENYLDAENQINRIILDSIKDLVETCH